MIFVGFGFLMTFLRHYSYSALSLNFFCSCLVMLAAILSVGCAQQVRYITSCKLAQFHIPHLVLLSCLQSFSLWAVHSR